MANIMDIFNALGPLFGDLFQLSIMFSLVGVGFWAIEKVAPKASGMGLNVFKRKSRRSKNYRRSYR